MLLKAPNRKGRSLRRIVDFVAGAAMLVLAGLFLTTQAAASSQSHTPSKRAVVLTVTLTDGTQRNFTMRDLGAMDPLSFTTTTPWTTGPSTFEGVRLRDVLAAAGAKGSCMEAIALNDYVSFLPFEDAMNKDVLIAYKMDGRRLTVRNKGPLWIIYPFDQDPSLKKEAIYARSVWQLRRLNIQP